MAVTQRLSASPPVIHQQPIPNNAYPATAQPQYVYQYQQYPQTTTQYAQYPQATTQYPQATTQYPVTQYPPQNFQQPTQPTQIQIVQTPQTQQTSQTQIPQTPEATQEQYKLYQQQLQAHYAYQQQIYQQQLEQQQLQLQYQQMAQLAQMPNQVDDDPDDISNLGVPQAGMVTRWIAGKRSGWIQGDNGKSVFVYYKDVIGARQDLNIGERVSFQVGWNAKAMKRKAEMVRPLNEQAPKFPTSGEKTGKVALWNQEKNFGFIQHSGGSVFVHNSDLVEVKRLFAGQYVKFEITINPALNKQKAVKVTLIPEPEDAEEGTVTKARYDDAPEIGPATRPITQTQRFAPY